jgi:hypothetical protein
MTLLNDLFGVGDKRSNAHRTETLKTQRGQRWVFKKRGKSLSSRRK